MSQFSYRKLKFLARCEDVIVKYVKYEISRTNRQLPGTLLHDGLQPTVNQGVNYL